MTWRGSLLLLSLLFLLGLSSNSARFWRLYLESAHQVAKTYQVLVAAEELRIAIEDARRGRRAYLATGEEVNLQLYKQAVSRNTEHEKTLQSLVGDNPLQRARLDALSRITASKLQELQETLSMPRNQRVKEALNNLQTDRDRKTMEEVRRITGELRDEEYRLLKGRSEQAEAHLLRTRKISNFSILLVMVLLIMATVAIERDARRRRRAEESLRASEQRFKALEQNSSDAVHLLSASGAILYESPSVIRVLGSSPEELVGRNSFELIHPDDAASAGERFAPLKTTPGLTLSVEVRIRHKDGSWPWMDCVATNLLDHPAVRAIVVNYRDITERKRTEEARRDTEQRLSFALRTNQIGAWELSLRDKAVNRTLIHDRIFGYQAPLPFWNYQMFLEHVLQEDRADVERSFREATAARADWSIECRIRRADGEIRWIYVAGDHEWDSEGRVRRMSGIVQDITHRKQAERRLGMRNAVSRVLADSTSLAEATPGIIRAICEAELWEFGSIWEVDAASELLRCRETWHRPDFQGEAMAAQTRVLSFAIGHGLPGRVWASGEVQLIPDVALDGGYLRAPLATAAGLRSALAFPILVDDDVTGVIEFAAREIRQPDQQLIDMFVAIGRQVGQFIERGRAEAALREGEERFRTLANSIPQLAWIARANGFIYGYNERWYEYTGTTAEQMEGYGWQTVYDPEALPGVLENWTRAIGSDQPLEMEFPLRGADGKFRTFLTRVHPLKDSDGRVVQWFGTNTDVEELKRMERSLRVSQARLHSALAAGSIGTWTWDIVNDLLVADEFTARMFSVEPGAAAEGLPVAVYLRAIVEEDLPGVENSLARAIQSCGYYDIEYRVRQKDGELRWLQSKGRVEGDGAGKALTFHAAVIDITERKRTEGRFRRLVDSNAQGVVFWNTKSEITGANDAFLRIVGYSRQDLEAGHVAWAAMTPPEYSHLDQVSLEELSTKGICTPFEKEYIRKDGSRVPILLGAATFEDIPDEGVCFLIDITERRKTDQALRESEEHFRFLNDLSEATRTLADPEQIMAVTARMLGQHLRASRCAYADVEKDGEEFTIRHDYTDGCASTVGNYRLSPFGSRAVATLQSGQTLIVRDVDAELPPADGSDMFNAIGIKAIITCPLIKEGCLRALVAVHQSAPRDWKPGEILIVQEVVERCWATIERRTVEEKIYLLNAELEQRVVERTVQLEAANSAKTVFLSTMSHEIRTPMNAILGYAQLMLRDPGLGADTKANLQIIGRSGEHLLTLINEVLDMSKIEAGRTQLNPVTFDLSNMLNDLAAMFRLRAAAKALQFEMRFDGELLFYVVADEGKIRQALINLLGNAIKFTSHGQVGLHVTLERRSANRLWLLARIEDTGPGMTDEEQTTIFEPFSQAKAGLHAQEGTGLGLAITRKYARLMGGDVTVSASPATGSVFTFEIPIERGESGVAVTREAARRVIRIRAGTKAPGVLIVDDQLENRDWLMKLLTSIGFSVHGAINGEAAIRDWEEWNPELILMDIHMPVMDGLEATRRIKADPRGKETAIVVLTASAMNEDRRTVAESGADDFLAKPCREDDLLEKVGALLGIVYDYEEVSGGETQPPAAATSTRAERLGQLPPELVERLRNATLSGNKRLLDSLILDVREAGDVAFAKALKELAGKYDYDALAQTLE